MDPLLLEQDYSFLGIMMKSLYVKIGVLFDQIHKIVSGIGLSRYFNSSFSRTTDLGSSITVSIGSDTFLGISAKKQILIVSFWLVSWWLLNAQRSVRHSYFVDPKAHTSLKWYAWRLPKSSQARLFCQGWLLGKWFTVCSIKIFSPFDEKCCLATAPLFR